MRSARAAAVVVLATMTLIALNACAGVSGPLPGNHLVTPSMGIGPSPSPFPGCPVTPDVLYAALKADIGYYLRFGQPDLLTNVDCYKGFATAKAVVKGQALDGRVLFGNDGNAWRPLNIGSANFCVGYVPPDIAAHFDGCG